MIIYQQESSASRIDCSCTCMWFLRFLVL